MADIFAIDTVPARDAVRNAAVIGFQINGGGNQVDGARFGFRCVLQVGEVTAAVIVIGSDPEVPVAGNGLNIGETQLSIKFGNTL